MWDERFEELLRRHLPYLAPDEALEPDLPLRDYGLDSLASVELLLALEKAYGARLEDEELSLRSFASPEVLWSTLSGAIARTG